ncbi:MAG: hypothetical protein OK454_05245, partial [Thaumarchaeota archaeon]|nr:hypothetical protein [Nitrososphaerota archaeon]
KPTQIIEGIEHDDQPSDEDSRRQSLTSERKTSLRTEALIQAAARAVVARIERGDHEIESISETEEGDRSLLGITSDEEVAFRPAESVRDVRSFPSHRNSTGSSGSHSDSQESCHHVSDEGGGSSSSHNEAEEDVFSDHSPRSSIGSYDGRADNMKIKSESTAHVHPDSYHDQNITYRSPRMSSAVSDISQYEKEDFVPTCRETPRPPFRTPSSVRAMQMSSPTPSVFSPPRCPRSNNKRHTGISTGGLPTVSRLGSPTVSAQYSPKGRSTPTRFRAKNEAPLVLLHVTLLPLRWAWADVLDGLDTAARHGFEPSEQLRNLQQAWRQLHDRVGDTVFERGILLPHPQNDYEVLEERSLEALELPLRHRARILECGHYLGPANETTTIANEDEASEDDDSASDSGSRRAGAANKRHWCYTCRSDIRFEDLGAGRVFRVKVYASNGLLKAGAWEACWKEMERVDIEVEPIIESGVLGELEKLAALRVEEQHHHRQREEEVQGHRERELSSEDEQEQEL